MNRLDISVPLRAGKVPIVHQLPAADVTAPSLLRRLRDELVRHDVAYCQWKGHWDPQRWERGTGDVDLLVARQDGGRLQSILAGLDFKQTVAAAPAQTPGVVSYFGFDPAAERLIHVHVHFQVRIGDAWALNYHLPVERAMLSCSAPGALFRIPSPELEFIVFVLRMTVGHSWRSAFAAARETRRAHEWEYLAGRVRQDRVRELVRDHLPSLTPTLFERCVRSLSPRCSFATRLQVSWLLRRSLEAHAAHTALGDAGRRLLGRCRHLARRALGRTDPRQHLLCGGLVIGVLGGDGAGKSTVVRDTSRWLSHTFDTTTLHLGKPPRSLPTTCVAVLRRTGAYVRRLVRRPAGTSVGHAGPSLLLQARAVCIARDRYRLYRRACREAARGHIVICDRYPTPYIRCMDGPSLCRTLGDAPVRWWTRALIRAERACYDRILPPELLIVLRVDPEVAVARKTDEDAAYVRARSSEVWALDLRDTPVCVVDADRPAAEVLGDVRALVWAHC